MTRDPDPSPRLATSIPWLWGIVVVIAAAAQIVLLWGTAIPLGIPGEWTWPRIPIDSETLIGLAAGTAWGAGYLGFVWLGARRIERARSAERSLWLIGFILAAAFWLGGVLTSLPGVTGLMRIPFVLYYPRTSGYFWQAAYEVESLPEFLAGYQEAISDSSEPDNYLHIGTHPPGLTTGFVLLRSTCERLPWLTEFANRWQPESVTDAFAIIAQNALLDGQPLSDVDRATLWIAGLLTIVVAGGAVCPLYLLVSRSQPARASWLWAALWPTVPAVVIFLPKSDLLFPTIALVAQVLWLRTLAKPAPVSAAACGLLMLLGLTLSLALVPVGVAFVLQFLWCLWRRPVQRSTLVINVVIAATFFCAGIVAVGMMTQLNLVTIWWQNVQNHAAFYDHNTRSRLAWLGVNVFELAGALGFPLFVSLLPGWVRAVRHGLTAPQEDATASVAVPLNWAPLVVWGLLWLSGKNMGEAARLWLFLMPLLIWAGTTPAVPQGTPGGESSTNRKAECALWCLVIAQVFVCLATALRVDGFDFAGV